MKNRTRIALVLFTLGFIALNAQVEDKLLKVNALLPGVSYELGLGATTTLNVDAILGVALRGGSNSSTRFGIFPGIGVEGRKYVNFNRRLRKQKNIAGNSGNYVSLATQLQLGSSLFGDVEFASDYFYNVGFMYGIQRMRPKGFYWGISFGPAVLADDFGVDGAILSNVRLGWVLNRRKNK